MPVRPPGRTEADPASFRADSGVQDNTRSRPVLSARLQAVADLVPPCAVVYDIGTDHAWLPIWLIMQERCTRAVAADLRPGPLSRARSNIESFGLADRICCHLGDGLSDLSPGADDVTVLAGLGGLEIIRILQAAGSRIRQAVLQPMKSLPQLRSQLASLGYLIDAEELVREGRHFYPVLRVRRSSHPPDLSDLECWVGPCLLQGHSPFLDDYLRFLLVRLDKQRRGQPQLDSLIKAIRHLYDNMMS